MKYKKIKLSFKYCEKNRFYRTFLVDENLNLKDFGCALITAFNGAFEHNFMFKNKNNTFNPRVFMEEFIFENDVLMDDYKVADLGDKFEFIYDTGDGWEFDGKVYANTFERDYNEQEIVLIDGAGQGIWEDNIRTLIAYFKGNLDGESLEINEDFGYFPPWNFSISKYSDFDNYDLEDDKGDFYIRYRIDADEYKRNEAEYFGDEYISEFDDVEDDDIEPINPELGKMIIKAVDEQIKTLSYVKETYERLKKDYYAADAKKLIASELLLETHSMLKENRAFNEEKYKKALKKLK